MINVFHSRNKCGEVAIPAGISLLLRRFVFRMVSRTGGRETRVTGDEAQGTMGRVKKGDARFLLPAFLCAQIFIERERDVRVSSPKMMGGVCYSTKFLLPLRG